MLLSSIAKRFDLSVVRARSLVRAAIFQFIFVGTVTAMKSATNALYLARREAQDLPYLYLATALVVALVTSLIGRELARSSAKPVLSLSLWVSAGILFSLSVLAAGDRRESLGFLYVTGETYATAISILFWARLGEVFDVRAAKRVFGSIAAMGMAGAIAGGLLVKACSGFVPAVTWCFVAAAALLVLRRTLGEGATTGTIRRERTGFSDGLRYAAAHPFPRRVAFLVLAFAVQSSAVDFVFRTGAVRFEGSDETSLAAMFGLLNAVVGVLAIIIQVTLTAGFLRRLGVFAYLSIIPFACATAGLFGLALPALFLPLYMLKVFEMMGSYSLYQPGLQLLYNPMPGGFQGSVRALIDGGVKKLGAALGGIVLLLSAGLLGASQLLALTTLLSLLVVVWIRFLRASYLQALGEKLGGHGPGKLPVLDPSERSTRLELVRALSAGGADQTLTAISLLEGEQDFEFREHIGALIAHPSEAVRFKAIELIERSPGRDYAPFLESVLMAEDRLPKVQAARALVLVDPERARVVLEPILSERLEADPGRLAAALVALLEPRAAPAVAEEVVKSAHRALGGLLARGKSLSASDRRQVVRLIGHLGPSAYAVHLPDYFEDPSALVRDAAIEAAGQTRDPALVGLLIRQLTERRVQRSVREALAAFGETVIKDLGRTLNDRRIEVSLRVQVPRILRLIGTDRAAAEMLYSNIHDDAYLRYVTIEELGRMRRDHPGLVFDRVRTVEAVLRRLRAYAHYRPIASDLSVRPELLPLYQATADRLRQNLHAGLRLLGLLTDPSLMETAYLGILSGEPGPRADAIELVDVALSGLGQREEVLAALETDPPLADGSRAHDRARELCEGRDMVLALIAHENLRRLGESAPEVREPTSGEPLMPKTLLDRIFLLQSVQLFRGLSVDDLSAVAAITAEGHAEPRQTIYREGETGEAMYVIVSGEIRLLSKGKPLLDLRSGDSFGQTSLLDGGTRPVTAVAGEEGVDFMVLERQPFLDLLTDRPGLLTGLFVELGGRIRELIELSHGGSTPSEKHASLGGGRDSSRPGTLEKRS